MGKLHKKPLPTADLTVVLHAGFSLSGQSPSTSLPPALDSGQHGRQNRLNAGQFEKALQQKTFLEQPHSSDTSYLSCIKNRLKCNSGSSASQQVCSLARPRFAKKQDNGGGREGSQQPCGPGKDGVRKAQPVRMRQYTTLLGERLEQVPIAGCDNLNVQLGHLACLHG